MAKNDIKVVSQDLPVITMRTEAAATAIYAGEPVKIGGTGTNYAVPGADAEPNTTTLQMGIAVSDSTQTATADGTVDVALFVPGALFEGQAKSAAAIDTEAELLGLINDLVAFDLTSSSYTIETASAASTNGLRILGGDVETGTILFTPVMQASQVFKTS